jgi:hypothetical protein
VNAIQKPLSSLKNVLQKHQKAFQVFWQFIYQASRETRCRNVVWFCHPLQRKRNTKSKKHSCKNNACLQCSVTWQTDAIGFHKCDLGLLSLLLSLRQLQQ